MRFSEYISECVCIKFNESIYITMKKVQGQTTENTFKNFGFDVLTNEEMNVIKGGADSKPKTRPRDIFDLEEAN